MSSVDSHCSWSEVTGKIILVCRATVWYSEYAETKVIALSNAAMRLMLLCALRY